MGKPTERKLAYIDDGFLSLDTSDKFLLLDLDHEIPGLVVSGDDEGDVELIDLLCPFVRQRSLLLLFLGAGSGLLGGVWF